MPPASHSGVLRFSDSPSSSHGTGPTQPPPAHAASPVGQELIPVSRRCTNTSNITLVLEVSQSKTSQQTLSSCLVLPEGGVQDLGNPGTEVQAKPMCLTNEVGIPSYHLTLVRAQVKKISYLSYFLFIGPKPALAPFLYGKLFAV